jgi:hypothetical protein
MARRRELTSPGRATAGRAAAETHMVGALLPVMEAFVAGVRRDALAALRAPLLLAAGPKRRARLSDPFTLLAVQQRWQVSTTAMTVWVNEFLRTPEQLVADHLDGMLARLADSTLPLDVYTSVRDVLLAGQAGAWSTDDMEAALADALSMDTPAATRTAADTIEPVGFSFRDEAMKLLRTEATGAFNVGRIGQARQDGFGFKKWVAHHDKHTRATHLDASGQTVPVSQDFIVGGAAMAYPGDPKGPFRETVNCRCSTVAVDQPSN